MTSLFQTKYIRNKTVCKHIRLDFHYTMLALTTYRNIESKVKSDADCQRERERLRNERPCQCADIYCGLNDMPDEQNEARRSEVFLSTKALFIFRGWGKGGTTLIYYEMKIPPST